MASSRPSALAMVVAAGSRAIAKRDLDCASNPLFLRSNMSQIIGDSLLARRVDVNGPEPLQ